MDASYVDLADPSHLEFDYLRMWISGSCWGSPVRAGSVHVGGGACALARALAAEDPGGRQHVCEVDPEVLALAREHLGTAANSGTARARGRRGEAFVAGPAGASSWDAVVIDAFVGAAVPRRLIRHRGFADVARVAPLALVNIVDDRSARDVRTGRGGVGDAPTRSVWALGARGGNTILAAEDGAALDLERIAGSRRRRPLPRAGHDTVSDGDRARRRDPVARPGGRGDLMFEGFATHDSRPNAGTIYARVAGTDRRCCCSTATRRPT